jgi:hypothetical protein
MTRMSRVVQFKQHAVAVYILTLGDKSRLEKLQCWRECFGTDLEPLLFHGIAGAREWGRADAPRRWRPGLWKQMVQGGVVRRLSGPALHNLTPAEVAVALGFLCILRDLHDSGVERALVLEDDANFLLSDQQDTSLRTQGSQEVRSKIEAILDVPDWHLVRLGGIFTRGFQPWATVHPGLELGVVRSSLGTHATLFSRRACEPFLRTCLPLHSTIDHQLLLCARQLGIPYLEVLPHFIGQDLLQTPRQSTIGYSPAERRLVSYLHRHRLSPMALASECVLAKKLLCQLLFPRETKNPLLAV